MLSARLALLALVASVAVAASRTSYGDTTTPSVTPQTPVAPPHLTAAIVGLRKACAPWQSATTPALPGAAASASKPMPMPAPLPLNDQALCAYATHQDQVELRMFITGAALGAILFFFGLIAFSVMRGTLISVWNWRLPLGEKSW